MVLENREAGHIARFGVKRSAHIEANMIVVPILEYYSNTKTSTVEMQTKWNN